MRSARRLLVAGIVWSMSLCGISSVSLGQTMIGTTGASIDELDLWKEVPVSNDEPDRGIVDRVLAMLQPHLDRLNTTNHELQELCDTDGPRRAAAKALEKQRSTCEDILAVIGILKRHNSEIDSWNLGASLDQYVLSSEALQLERPVVADSADSLAAPSESPMEGQTPKGKDNYWPYLASVWLPVAATIEFEPQQTELLTQFGISESVWSKEPDSNLFALITTLRQADLDPTGNLTPSRTVRELAAEIGETIVVKHDLAAMRADPAEIAQIFRAPVGWKDISRLSTLQDVRHHTLAAGTYEYRSLPPQSLATVFQSSDAVLAKGFLDRLIRLGSGNKAADAYNKRVQFHALIVSELTDRLSATAAGDHAQRVALLYSPYVSACARAEPCLTPFQPTLLPDSSGLKFTDQWNDNRLESPWAAENSLNETLRDRGVAPTQDVFLLQADYDARESNAWRPRVAGFRGYLNMRKDSPPQDSRKDGSSRGQVR